MYIGWRCIGSTKVDNKQPSYHVILGQWLQALALLHLPPSVLRLLLVLASYIVGNGTAFQQRLLLQMLDHTHLLAMSQDTVMHCTAFTESFRNILR